LVGASVCSRREAETDEYRLEQEIPVDTAHTAHDRPLRPGDVVEVKVPEEIFATLDGDAIDDMPFMAEMLQHAGRRYTVSRRVDKICDTIAATGSRRMESTVYLDDLRCDGSAHGGCQAACRLYWKEAWLRRVDEPADAHNEPPAPSPALDAVLEAGAHTVRDAEERWRCQNTEALKASTHLRVFKDPGQYWREFNHGNYGRLRFVWKLARAMALEVANRLGFTDQSPLRGPEPKAPDYEPLDLQPGEWVQVRSPEEIEPTLDDRGHNRGLSFDREMLRYCGQTLRVQARVNQIIDEKTGRMLNIRRDAIILEGSVCTAECSPGRWFCPREIPAYWREGWLKRVEAPVQAAADTTGLPLPMLAESETGSPVLHIEMRNAS
jgi:hypothetical protein